MLIHVLLVSACLRFVTSIRCYDCNSANNTMCLDPNSYDQETLRRFMVLAECGQGVIPNNQRYFCRKIEQVVYHKYRENEIRVARGCGWVRSHLECYKADNENHLETVCQCFDDACNAATSVLAKWTLLVAAVTVVVNKWLKLLLALLLKSLTNPPTVSKPNNKDYLESVYQ